MLGMSLEVPMKTRVLPDECIACGLCVDLVPAVFREEDDTVVATGEAVAPDDEDGVREASDSCPVEAIVIDE